MTVASKVGRRSLHEEFAMRAQLLRWFHERTYKELEALKQAFEQSKGLKKRGTK